MIPAIIVLLLILLLFGGGGFIYNVLWYVLIVAIAIWLIGWFIGGPGTVDGGRRWYRW